MADVAVTHVRVTNAVAGTELLAWTALPCTGFVRRVLGLLESRPSRPVRLLLNDATVGDLAVAPDDQVELTAVMSEALTEEKRQVLLEQLADEVRFTPVPHPGSKTVPLVFSTFCEAARDDKAVVLTAVQRHGSSLEYASDLCKNDKEIVLAAVSHRRPPEYGGALQFASELWKNDEEVVLKAVQYTAFALAHSGDLAKTDTVLKAACFGPQRDVRSVSWARPTQAQIVVQVMQCYGLALEFCPPWAFHNKEIVLTAVKQNGLALEYAEDFVHDMEVVLSAVQQNGSAWEFAGDTLRNDKDIVLAAELAKTGVRRRVRMCRRE